jgi:hypothetical protein
VIRGRLFVCVHLGHARLLLNSQERVDHCHVNPPTEQLIRDYLNRLALAARDKLEFPERQALLDRTRAWIEAECGGVNGASAAQVGKALASLGDPIALVEREVGQTGGGRMESANNHRPDAAENGHQNAAGQAEDSELAEGSEIGMHLLVGGGSNGSRRDRAASSGRSVRAGSDAHRRRRRSDDSSTSAAAKQGSRNPRIVPAQRRPPDSNDVKAAKPFAGHEPRNQSGPTASANGTSEFRTEQFGRPSGPAAVGVGKAAGTIRDLGPLARANKLEFFALALLGIGGFIYPPVWLLGVILAMPSRKWDLNDKFLGIVMPVVLVIVGTVVILVFGGEHSSLIGYVKEAWVGAVWLSRAFALLGALFLLRSLRRGRRQPKQPPWNVPHRLG